MHDLCSSACIQPAFDPSLLFLLLPLCAYPEYLLSHRFTALHVRLRSHPPNFAFTPMRSTCGQLDLHAYAHKLAHALTHTMCSRMSLQVILAMETGTYSFAVDIWSLGVTLIELAETKPPLFELHAMSACYQIANNPPPTLSEPGRWSTSFADFLSHCLVLVRRLSRVSLVSLCLVLVCH
jgi:serine/threonine protein kinase